MFAKETKNKKELKQTEERNENCKTFDHLKSNQR